VIIPPNLHHVLNPSHIFIWVSRAVLEYSSLLRVDVTSVVFLLLATRGGYQREEKTTRGAHAQYFLTIYMYILHMLLMKTSVPYRVGGSFHFEVGSFWLHGLPMAARGSREVVLM
jgi:hypothetical protein